MHSAHSSYPILPFVTSFTAPDVRRGPRQPREELAAEQAIDREELLQLRSRLLEMIVTNEQARKLSRLRLFEY